MKRTFTLITLFLIVNISQSLAQAWQAMASGLGASTEEVKTVAVDPNGKIYVGGTFTNVNGSISYLATWTGSAWAAVGGGVNGPVYSIGIKTASDIYIGGQFTDAGGVTVSNIARWNGSAWSAVGDGFNNKVLCVYTPGSGIVYAGGEFSLSGSTAVSHIAKLQAGVWVAMGSGVPANVNAIVEHSGSVYAGCDQSSGPVLKYDGSSAWTVVSGLSSGKVSALASFGGFLYAGGTFTSPTPACAKWDGTTWNTIVTNFSFGQRVNVLYTRTDALYIGGNFTGVGLSPQPNYIARIAASNQPIKGFTISSELTSGEVFAIGKSAGYVVAGGKFATPTSPVTNNISITSTTIDVNELSNLVVDQTLYPNPAHGKTTLTINTVSPFNKPELKIFDVQSKLIQTEIQSVVENNRITYNIDLATVPAGHYYYVLLEDGQPVTSNIFIVE